MELSVCSAGGMTQPQTMKLQGVVQGQKILVLIDSGASYNFIYTKLVQRLGLLVEPTTPHKVRLGDGQGKSTRGHCKDMKLTLGEYEFVGEFFVFELGGVDAILGVAWLQTLGEVKVNWRTLTMTFHHQGRNLEIRGDPSLSKALISSRALMTIAEVEAMAMLWLVEKKSCVETRTEKSQLSIEEEEQQVLNEFEQVFSEPKGLPPPREVDHRIPIKAGIDPVNVPPYRYPYLQKKRD